MDEFIAPYSYQAISDTYERAHKNDNRNAMAQANNANSYNYYMWLNSVAASRQMWQEQFDATNEYNTPLNQRKRLEEAGINPAFANFNSDVSMPSSSLSSPAPASKADSFAQTPNILASVDSLNTSIGNYFNAKHSQAQSENLDAQTDFMRASSQYRLLQERQQYLNMIKQASGMDIDSDYKQVLIDTAKDGLMRLNRLSKWYDEQVIGSAKSFEQDRKESDARITRMEVQNWVDRYVAETGRKLANGQLQLMKSQANYFYESASNLLYMRKNILPYERDKLKAEVNNIAEHTAYMLVERYGKEQKNAYFDATKDVLQEMLQRENELGKANEFYDTNPIMVFYGRLWDKLSQIIPLAPGSKTVGAARSINLPD